MFRWNTLLFNNVNILSDGEKNTFETEKKPKKSHPTMFDTKPPHRMKERKKITSPCQCILKDDKIHRILNENER